MPANLIEICCKCGFVHRDDRHSVSKQRKLHYHWMPENNEKEKNGYTLHATICASCVERDGMIDWVEYDDQRKKTPSEYYVCLLYTSPSPRDRTRSRMPSSA